MKVKVQTLDAKAGGDIELNDEIFAVEPRADILHRVVSWQLTNRRAPARAARERSDVARTGTKFGRQKGGGTARHGSRRAPQFRGGGRAFGPTPRSHAIDLPKKVRALALRHALSAKARAGELSIVDTLQTKEPKTAALRAQFGKLEWLNALIIDGADLDQNFALAARNIPQIDVLPIQGINVADILRRNRLVLTKAAVEALEARFA
jgi:large subunit ribosomal protein L4